MGGGETTSTVTQSNLPEYAEPYFTSLMDRSFAESQHPYQPYGGQRIADQSASTLSGLGAASRYGHSGVNLGPALGLAQSAGNAALNYGAANPITSDYKAGSYKAGNFKYDKAGFGDLVNKVAVEDFDAAQRDKYMSPYMQAVVDKAKQDAAKDALMEEGNRNLSAAKAGAFGGSRAAVQAQLARDAGLDRMTDITVQGTQAAFENAQQQFERDRAARFGADTANQGTGLQMLLSNQQADLETQRMREQSRQFGFSETERARQAQAQLGLDAQKATQGFGLQGLQIANESALGLGQLYGQQDKMTQDRFRALLASGQAQEDFAQRQLDQDYMDFTNQRDAERQNLQFLSSILRGVPISANSEVSTTQPTNPLAGIMGTAGGLQALYALGQQ